MTETLINENYQSIADMLEDSFERYADKPAYSCLGQTLSYAEIEEKSRGFAAWLQNESGLVAGDRIAIQLPNLIQFPIAAYGALRAGLVLVNTNPLYTPTEMRHQFKDSGAKAVVILADLMPKLEKILDETDIEKVILTGAADLLTGESKEYSGNQIALNRAIEIGSGLKLAPRPAGSLDDASVLQYTGGTTGVSKGATLTHRNILSNAAQTLDRIGDRCRIGEETFACPLPLYHIYAFCVNMMVFFSRGNLNVLIPNPRDLDAFIGALKPFKLTGFAGINTLFVGLCHQEDFKALDFSKLRLTISGGTALTSSASDLWHQVTGCTISEGYGLSETAPVVCLNEPGNEEVGTVGQALLETEIQIWNEHDQPVALGEEGQLVVRGPQVMQGYWNRPGETEKAISADGFFKTGDIAVAQENGNFKIVDRLKDMVIVSGFNVYPNEIEDALASHPQVVEAAVIGKPDDKTGEKVCAFITVEGDVSEDEVIAHCRETLTAYKVPKEVVFLDELPKSTVGKILRRELRK